MLSLGAHGEHLNDVSVGRGQALGSSSPLDLLPAPLLGLSARGERLHDTTQHIRLPRKICLRVATEAHALTSARADIGVYLSRSW